MTSNGSRDAASPTITLRPSAMDIKPTEKDDAPTTATTGTLTTPTAPQKDKHSLGYAIRSGLAGGLAGCAAKTVVGPLDRVKILFQASNPQYAKYSGSWAGLLAAMREISHQDGAKGLFRGHSMTLLRIFPYAGIKFLAYEQYRAVLIPTAAHETSFRRLLSGSLAGLTSVFFTYPLEVVRVRMAFETRRDRQQASLARICRQIFHEQPPARAATPPLASSALAAAASDLSQGSLRSAAAHTAEAAPQPPRSGLANFYRGFSPTLVGILPYAGFSFLTHDVAGDFLRHPLLAPYTTLPSTAVSPTPKWAQADTLDRPRPRLNNAAQLVAGAMAGLVSQTASYPLEVIRRRMQVGGAVGRGERHGMSETARFIWRERGLSGFFVGLGIGYLKVVPMVAVSFWTYERAKHVLGI